MNSIIKLYDGAVVLAFDEDRHEYTANGKPCPGVTTILKVVAKPALVGWAVKCCAQYLLQNLQAGTVDEVQITQLAERMKRNYRDVMGEAAAIGTIVHAYAEKHFKGQKPKLPVNEAARNSIEAFIGWTKAHEVKPVAMEYRVYSLAHNFSGTGDLRAYIDDKLTCADYKTSTGIWPEYFLQNEAYMIASEEEDAKLRHDGQMVLRFDKTTGRFETSEFHARGKFEAGFLGAVALSRALELGAPKRRWRNQRQAPAATVVPEGLTWASARLLEALGTAAEELYTWECEREGLA